MGALRPAFAQTAQPDEAPAIELQHRTASQPVASSIDLSIPKGTPLEIVLDREVRVKGVGQAIAGRVIEPVYAFDKLEIPAGSQVTGKILGLQGISAARRTEAALNADFTPARKVQISFTEISLPDGRKIPIQTTVTPGSGQVLDFVAAADSDSEKRTPAGAVSDKVQAAKRQAHQEWTAAMGQLKAPGKIHRAERYAFGQLPVRPQFIEADSVYFAELEAPLSFGTEQLMPETARSIGSVPQDGAVVRARLATGLTSASNQKGDAVKAVVTQPLFEQGRLIIPQGSVLAGSVVQVCSARRMKRNGQLRIVFQELRLPSGVAEQVEASLQSVQADKGAELRLDSEGGAQATTPRTRYLSTAASLGLAGLSLKGDSDSATPNPAGNASNRAAGGAVGYKLVGITLGLLVHSRAFGYSMGAYGAGMSVYSHFLARGRDVVFPKDTAMQIGLGVHDNSLALPPFQSGSGQ